MHSLPSYLENFAFTDAIDILIVSFIVYRFLLLVQGTRAVQMIVGIMVAGSLYWFSITYKLYSLNWMLNHFFQYFFIVLMILFQEQIRTALISAGKVTWLRRGESLKDEQVEEVVTACGVLARERKGAIIVFEKSSGLMNYADTGTILNCEIHSDVIYSLFQNSSPLHDGAVIVTEQKILAAGCFLPLSKNVELDRHYGTRHRAALGLTELTDAVVITVSEETGRMNICHQGVFYFMEDEKTLRKYIRQFLFEDTREVITEIKAKA